MPLYEYECQQCHRHTEKRQKFSDPEITECPHCGGRLQRVLSAPAIAFKGGGWYADGYGNRKPQSSADSGSGKSDTPAPSPSADSSKPAEAAKPAAAASGTSPASATPAPAAATKS